MNQRWWISIEKSPGGLCLRSALSVNVKSRSYLNTTSVDLALTTLNAFNVMNELFAILLQEARNAISLESFADKKKACERANVTMELLIAEHGMKEEEIGDLLHELV